MSGSIDLRAAAQLRQNLHFINTRLVNARTQTEMARLVAEYLDAVGGLAEAAGLLANGASVVGGLVPGGAVISAAVSSVGSVGGSSGGQRVENAYG